MSCQNFRETIWWADHSMQFEKGFGFIFRIYRAGYNVRNVKIEKMRSQGVYPWLMKIQKHPMHAWNTNQILNTFLSGNVLPFNCTRWLLGHVYNMKNQFWAGLGSQASMYCGKKKFWKYCSVRTEKLHRIKFKKKSKKELRRIFYGEKISM